jgi:hypothetical protein
MHRPSSHSVVNQLVSRLAESRRSRIERHAAYVALARAILADELLEAPVATETETRASSHAA